VTQVNLGDGEPPVQVEIEFLAPTDAKLKRNQPKLLPGFRVLQADGCAAAFHAPEQVEIFGRMVGGARNKVCMSVAALPDFLIMKTLALAGRDKPKDAYDLCYCLDNYPGGLARLTKEWKQRAREKNVAKAGKILREKFEAVDAYLNNRIKQDDGQDDGIRGGPIKYRPYRSATITFSDLFFEGVLCKTSLNAPAATRGVNDDPTLLANDFEEMRAILQTEEIGLTRFIVCNLFVIQFIATARDDKKNVPSGYISEDLLVIQRFKRAYENYRKTHFV